MDDGIAGIWINPSSKFILDNAGCFVFTYFVLDDAGCFVYTYFVYTYFVFADLILLSSDCMLNVYPACFTFFLYVNITT